MEVKKKYFSALTKHLNAKQMVMLVLSRKQQHAHFHGKACFQRYVVLSQVVKMTTQVYASLEHDGWCRLMHRNCHC